MTIPVVIMVMGLMELTRLMGLVELLVLRGPMGLMGLLKWFSFATLFAISAWLAKLRSVLQKNSG